MDVNTWFECYGSICEDIDAGTNAEKSKQTYKGKIKKFMDAKGFPDIFEVLEECNPNNNDNTEINNYNAILRVATLSQTFHDMIGKDQLDALREAHDYITSKTKDEKHDNPVKTKDTDVSWDYLVSLKDNLEKPNVKGDDRLLYYLYVSPGIGFVPRNDFVDMKLVDKMKDTENTAFNYYCRENKMIIFNQYKTSQRYGQIKQVISDDLAKHIPTNQTFMFEKSKGVALNENAMAKKIAMSFKRLSDGKNITLVVIRRAFATSIKDLPEGERRTIAHKMGHTASTNTSYTHTKGKCLIVVSDEDSVSIS